MLADSWSQNTIAIVAVAFLFAGITVIVWQVFATWRTRITVSREEAYQKLAEQLAQAQQKTADALTQTVTELTELRQRTTELEKVLKSVE